MREIIVKVFKFNELDKAIQNKIIERFQNNIGEWNWNWNFEFQETLKEFLKALPIDLIDYDIERLNSARITSSADSEVNLLSGVRLVKWLWNNASQTFSTPKYLGYVKNRCVYSKVVFERRANLTGSISDDYIMQPIIDFLNSKEMVLDKNINFFRLMKVCINSWLKGYRNHYIELHTKEYIVNFIEENGYEFYKDGRIV